MQVSTFNLDKSVNLSVQHSGNEVLGIYTEDGKRGLFELVSIDRYRNVKNSVKHLLSDKLASSVNTECGLVVGKGLAK